MGTLWWLRMYERAKYLGSSLFVFVKSRESGRHLFSLGGLVERCELLFGRRPRKYIAKVEILPKERDDCLWIMFPSRLSEAVPNDVVGYLRVSFYDTSCPNYPEDGECWIAFVRRRPSDDMFSVPVRVELFKEVKVS